MTNVSTNFHPAVVQADNAQVHSHTAAPVRTINHSEHIFAAHKLMLELNNLLQKVVDYQLNPVTIKYSLTDYVIPGCLYVIETKSGATYRFWIGVNGRKLSFISHLGSNLARVDNVFKSTFNESKKVGWSFDHHNFRASVNSITTLWGSCISPDDLIVPIPNSPVIRGDPLLKITPTGYFHLHEAAQVVQLFLRSMEIGRIECYADQDPAPI